MSTVKYNDILLNVNRRSFEVDDLKYKEAVFELEGRISRSNDMASKSLLEHELNVLNKQYEHYSTTKRLSKSSNSRKRKETIGVLVDDKHHSLLTHKLVTNTHRHLYRLDLSDSLDVAMSIAFDTPLLVTRERLNRICERNEIDQRVLSRSLMCQDDMYSAECDLPFSELTQEFPEVNNFVKFLCINEMEHGVPYLDSVSTSPYSNLIECHNLRDALITAFNLKLLIAATEVIQGGLVEFERQRRYEGFTGGVVSQYISGFVIGTLHPIDFSFHLDNGRNKMFFPVLEI